MKVVLLAEAQRRFEAEYRWWREHRDAKELFVTELEEVLRQVASMPNVGQLYRRARGKLIQRVLMKKTRCHVYYVHDPDAVSSRLTRSGVLAASADPHCSRIVPAQPWQVYRVPMSFGTPATVRRVALLGLLLSSTSYGYQGPGALRVLQVSAGPAGAEINGVFALSEERTVFSRVNDREVVVLFRWEGTPGPHRLVALWRSPDGSSTSTSTLDYMAKDRRFGAAWPLVLGSATALGMWSVEATVDGQPAGRLTFEVRDEKVAVAISKRPLTPAELYQRLNSLFVVLERSTSGGRQLDAVAGLLPAKGQLWTAMTALDGADSIRIVRADGSRLPATSVLSLHRGQDWAVLADPSGSSSNPSPVAAENAVMIGDRLFTMDGEASGSRVLVQGAVSGQNEAAGAGRRLLATFGNGIGMPGAPVLNEFGELVGMIGGANAPGLTRMVDLLRFREELKATPVIPASLFVLREGVAAVNLAELQQRGELVPALIDEEHISWGGFAAGFAKETRLPSDQRDRFSRQERTFVTFINWKPLVRLRGMSSVRIYDGDNQMVGQSTPAKADLRKDQLTVSWWTMPVPSAVGLYRVDALLDGKPMWRGYVRINP